MKKEVWRGELVRRVWPSSLKPVTRLWLRDLNQVVLSYLNMPKPKPIKDEEELSESNTTSEDEGPSATSKKRQLDGVCQFLNHSNHAPDPLSS